MSRAIKFRTWHKQEQKMYEVSGFFFGQVMFISPQENATSYTINSVPENQVELIQSTGLKDNNGREIYEGDIVRINHPYDRTGDFTNAIGRVFWDDATAAYYHSNDHGRPPKRMWEFVEVVGNIYENPDMLTKDDEA